MDLHAISYTNISNYIPKIGIASPQQVVKNLTKIAVPVIALVGASMIRESEASYPYIECVNNCYRERDAHDLAKLICHILCEIFAKKN